MAEIKRAQFVCATCSARKKACDKALPACGFCVKRGISCKYDGPAKKDKSFRTYNPGKYFVASGTMNNVPISPVSVENSSWSPDSLPLTTSISQSIHDSLNQQVHDVLNSANLTAEDISKRYFQSFHRLYPIMSPELFHQVETKQAQGGSASPSTDYSILILAMFLAITLPGHHRPADLSLSGQEQLYVKIKSLLAQIQTAIPPSFALVQVMFIVTIWEYTRARPEAAYSSINACSSLARILGVGNELLEKSGPYQSNTTNLEEIERRNVAWAVLMLERIILVEMNSKTIRPLTGYPDLNCQLPLDLLPSDSSLSQSIDYQNSMSATLSCFGAGNVSWFGRQAQAIFLLDRVLDLVRTVSKDNIIQGILQEAIELDSIIRNFLGLLLDESRQKKTTLCSAVAFSVRALFLLHWSIFDALPSSGNEGNYQTRNLSWTALNSAGNMTIDGIMYAEQDPDSPVPICSFYILQEAIRYLTEQQKVAGDEATVSDKDMLLRADKEYRSTYIF